MGQLSQSGTLAAGGHSDRVPGRRYRFGEFVVDVGERTLDRGGTPVTVQPKTFDLLAYLVTHPFTLHNKQHLLDAVWPGMVVTESSLTRAIHQLRTALDDTADSPRFVETVPRAGYRFIGDVERVEDVFESAQPLRSRLAVGLALAALAALALSAVYWLVPPKENLQHPPSIAVLPFVNMSADAENAYFSDGISEEILNQLSAFRELRVVARTSSFAFKDANVDVPTLSRLLDVRYLLQGSVRRQGTQVRITIQLVSSEGAQIWSAAYDRELRAIFDVQREIARTVAANIAPHLELETRDVARRRPNIDAYQHFLIGREILQKRLPLFQVSARDELSRAIELDPQFAEPYAELAAVQVMAADKGPAFAAELAAAQSNIDMALSLKPDFARAHAVQGLLLMSQEGPGRGAEAERALRRALVIDPSMTDTLNWLSSVLISQGRMAEAFAELEKAANLDPLAPAVISNLARLDAEKGDTDEGERRLRRLLMVPQPSAYAYPQLAELQWAAGRLAEATESTKRHALDVLRRSGKIVLGTLSQCYARLGLWEQAYRWQAGEEQDWPESLRALVGRVVLLRVEGRHAEARRYIDDALASWRLDLDTMAPGLGMQYGISQALAGDHQGAIRTLEALPWSTSFEPLTPALTSAHHIDGRQALAWAYLQLGRIDQARELLEYLENGLLDKRNQGFLHLSGEIFVLAQNAVLAGDGGVAMKRLEQAIEAGWRDHVTLAGDPRWSAVRGDPRLETLITRVQELVAAERRLVEETDAREDFATRLDRLIATQQP